MSVYVVRYIEIKNDNKWVPIAFNNNEPVYIVSNLSDIRQDLYNACKQNIPDDCSEEVKKSIEEEPYRYNVGYITYEELCNKFRECEKDMLNSLTTHLSSQYEDSNVKKMSDREILEALYTSINNPIRSIYEDYSWSLFSWHTLINEVNTLKDAYYHDYISEDRLRMIFYFA